ncbi:MAG: DUF4178 domain-containing protein [Cytophagales bacterium]|nr:DUF4178 domain-containing protein [Bernardetiaceae bacterium]MDW8211213.1 DUF4178 domain-containing protein [Cytophagales bacterium]
MFSFFKKKDPQPPKPHYDPTNIKVTDLRIGFVFDYDMKTWEVIDEFEYDWGDQLFTYEYKITSGTETLYMRVEERDKLYCIFTQKLPFGKLGQAAQFFKERQTGPSTIDFEGTTFYLDREKPGFFRSTQDEDSIEVIQWDYLDDTGKYILVIHQWDEQDFELSVGVVEPVSVVSNILPR